jgi:hypothetical protein
VERRIPSQLNKATVLESDAGVLRTEQEPSRMPASPWHVMCVHGRGRIAAASVEAGRTGWPLGRRGRRAARG